MNCHDVVEDLVITGVNFSDHILSRGAYGKVFVVDYKGIACAAKEIQLTPVIFNMDYRARYELRQACLQYSKLDHPNVVKMLVVHTLAYTVNPCRYA